MRLIQLAGTAGRRLGVVEGDGIRLLRSYDSVHGLAWAAMAEGLRISELVSEDTDGEVLDYGKIHAGAAAWRVLPAADHPGEPARCLVSGTGLSHIRSAANRQAMHAAGQQVTDSMRMYEWGVAGGRPEPGTPGVSPEWFYKGNGLTLRGSQRAAGRPCVRRRWRRGTGDRGGVHHR